MFNIWLYLSLYSFKIQYKVSRITSASIIERPSMVFIRDLPPPPTHTSYARTVHYQCLHTGSGKYYSTTCKSWHVLQTHCMDGISQLIAKCCGGTVFSLYSVLEFVVTVTCTCITSSLCMVGCNGKWCAHHILSIAFLSPSQSHWWLMPVQPWTKSSGHSQMSQSLRSTAVPLEHNLNWSGTRMGSRFQWTDRHWPFPMPILWTVESINVSGLVKSDHPKFLIVLAGAWWYVTEVGAVLYVHVCTHTHWPSEHHELRTSARLSYRTVECLNSFWQFWVCVMKAGTVLYL